MVPKSNISTPALTSIKCPIKRVPGVEKLGREDEYSPPSIVEVKNEWIYTPTPIYAFVACRETTIYATKRPRRLHTHYIYPDKNKNARL
jgi:hypothetical protein